MIHYTDGWLIEQLVGPSQIMWVKRTESELAEERRRRRRSRLRGSALCGLLVTTAGAFFYSWGEAGNRERSPVPLNELPTRLPGCLVFGVLAAALIYKFERKRPVMICPNCEATKYDDNLFQCSCGGRFEKLEEMKHVA
ncbi:MAG: hypothetical protein ABSG04_07935 [Verrucomicrobiota bacterium]